MRGFTTEVGEGGGLANFIARDLKARAGAFSFRYLDRFDGTLGPEFLGWHDLLGEDNVDYCRLTVFKNLKNDIAILERVTGLHEKLENCAFLSSTKRCGMRCHEAQSRATIRFVRKMILKKC